MYIRRKVFSRIWDEETNEEKLFSVKEINLEEITFARKDYEGLTEEGKKVLKERRDAYAKSLRKNYRDTMAGIDNVGGNYNKLTTRGNLKGGGIRTSYEVITSKGTADSAENFIKTHKNSVRNELGKQAKNAGELMRGETMARYREIPKAKPIAQEVKNSIVKKAEEAVKDQTKKRGFKLSRNQKIGAAALGTAALVGAGTYAYKKHKKSKEKKD